jgi:hypothetical protein
MTTKKATAKKSAPASGKDAAAFVDLIHKDKKFRSTLKKGWDEAIREGKKRGFKFTKQELHNHLKKRYGVKSLPKEDEPDTCICV